MKAFFVFTLLIVHCLQLYAQTYLEFRGGYSHNILSLNVDQESFEKVSSSGGFYFGGQINIKTLNRININTGIEIIGKNYLLSRTNKFTGVYQKHTNLFLQLPISVQIKLVNVKKLGFLFNSGVFVGYWLARSIDGTVPNAFNTSLLLTNNGELAQNFYLSNYHIKNQFDLSKDNRLEYGAHLGLQFQYYLAESFRPVLNVNYYHAFSDMQQENIVDQGQQSNRTLVFSFGVLVKLN